MKQKNKLLFFFLFFLLSIVQSAALMPESIIDQDPQHSSIIQKKIPGIKEIQKKHHKFIIETANLSKKEATLYFNDMKKIRRNQRSIFEKIQRASFRVYNERLTDKNFKHILQSIINMRKQINDLDITLYSNAAKYMSAEKIIKVMYAEQEFKKRLFRKKHTRNHVEH